jgi:hypothetical protein
MTPQLSISRLIAVALNFTQAGAQAQNLSDLLVLGSSNVIDVTERMRTYNTLADVQTDFGTNAPEALAATLWFEQAPQPTEIRIGRWAQTATNGKLVGGSLTAPNSVIGPWNAIITPAFEVEIDGLPKSIAPASFAGAANLNAVAALIQTALQAASAGVLCVYNANFNRFEITSGTAGVGSSIGFLNLPTATGSFTFAGQPAANDTITLNGTVWTFVAGAPVGNQIQIGANLAATIANAVAALSASVDVQTAKFKYFGTATVLGVKAAATGAGGNALTIAKVSANITVSGATLAGGSGTDISVMMSGTLALGAYRADGIAAESAAQATTIFDNMFGQQWYALMITGAADADHLAVAPLIEGSSNKHLYGVTTQEAGVISSVDQTNIAFQLKQLAFKRTIVQYSSTNPYAVASFFGRLLTVDYTGQNTVITMMYKQLPGIVAESLNSSQMDALLANNANVFVNYSNNTAIEQPGVCSSGDFADEIAGTDAMVVTVQTALYNLLFTSPTKIPQDDDGNHLLVTTITGVLQEFVNDGLLAPGVWNSQGFGTLSQGDFLDKGYYVFAPSINSQNPADRAARKSVPIQVAAKLAGAVHTVDMTINVNR